LTESKGDLSLRFLGVHQIKHDGPTTGKPSGACEREDPFMFEGARRLMTVAMRLNHLQIEVTRLRYEIDMVRSRADVPNELVAEFFRARQTADYQCAYDDPRPLVTICVGTYNRSELLVSRCLRSLARQTYDNLEIIVVGDCCTDGTADAVKALGDERVRFLNLTVRGPYPDDPRLTWMVAGTMPVNRALQEARGVFVTHLDDDDEHEPTRIERLLKFMRETRADLSFHPFRYEDGKGNWVLNPAHEFRYSQVTTSSIFYHHWLRRIPWDVNAYTYREPGDWNRLRKIQYLGANCMRYPEPMLRHYVERSQTRR
jgi:hypothetical protein